MRNYKHTHVTGSFLMLFILPIQTLCYPSIRSTEAQPTKRISEQCSITIHTPSDRDIYDDEKFPPHDKEIYKYDKKNIIVPGDNQKQLLEIAFGELPPFVCKAVNRVVFFKEEYKDDEGVVGEDITALVSDKYPDLIIIFAPEIENKKTYYPTEDNLRLKNGLLREYRKDPDTGEATSELVPAAETLQRELIIWKKTIKKIIHEAAHSAAFLLESAKELSGKDYCIDYFDKVRDPDYFDDSVWTSAAKTEAKTVLEKTGMQEGFLTEWCRLNNNFQKAKMSERYNENLNSKRDTQPGKIGFVSEYGQKDPLEDVAEIAALIQFNHYESTKDLKIGDLPHLNIFKTEWDRHSDLVLLYDYYNICKSRIQTIQKKNVPIGLAAVYTKINLLLDLGFITPDAYKECIGKEGKIGLQNGGKEEPGFHRLNYSTGEWIKSHYITKFGHAPVNSNTDDRLFLITGTGKVKDNDDTLHNMDIFLRFNKTIKPSLPRGIYKLSWPLPNCPPVFTSSRTDWTFIVFVENEPSLSYCAIRGQILVTRSNKNFFEATMYLNRRLTTKGKVGFIMTPNYRAYIRWQ